MTPLGLRLCIALCLFAAPSWAAKKKKPSPPKKDVVREEASKDPAPLEERKASPTIDPVTPSEAANTRVTTHEIRTEDSTDDPYDPVASPPPEPPPPFRAHAFQLAADVGVALHAHDFTSNGRTTPGSFTDYAFTSTGAAARLSFVYDFAPGKVGRIGADASYQLSSLSGVDAPSYGPAGAAPSVASLSLTSHFAEVALTAGARLDVLGGLDLRARIGGAFLATHLTPSVDAPLPSEQTLGLLVGARVALPAFAHVANRSLGVRLEGAYVPIARHAQNEGLEDGSEASATAVTLHGELSVGLTPAKVGVSALAVTLGYRLAASRIDYRGPSVRNDSTHGNVTQAHRSIDTHTFALGLRFSY